MARLDRFQHNRAPEAQYVRLGNEAAITTARETRMKIKTHDLTRKDWELCRTYVQEMKQKGFSVHEAWEFELEAWAAHANREPRKSTVTKLRIRVEDAR
jgi:hypothetical protein